MYIYILESSSPRFARRLDSCRAQKISKKFLNTHAKVHKTVFQNSPESPTEIQISTQNATQIDPKITQKWTLGPTWTPKGCHKKKDVKVGYPF